MDVDDDWFWFVPTTSKSAVAWSCGEDIEPGFFCADQLSGNGYLLADCGVCLVRRLREKFISWAKDAVIKMQKENKKFY